MKRGLRAEGNFIDDWVVHEKEMNIMGFIGEFEFRQKYEEAKRRALGWEEEDNDEEKVMDTVERLNKIAEEYIVDKETLREVMKKVKQNQGEKLE